MSFTVYKSSAGSGKTTALVREYIKLIILDPSNFARILAISFTNKAANEMKGRVVKVLQELASINVICTEQEIDRILPELSIELKNNNFTDFTSLPHKAKEILIYILHYYSDFSISTIDSFMYGIVRFFASDMFLSHDFTVDLDEDNSIKKAVQTLINKINGDDILTRFLIEYSLSLTDDEKNWNIENELSNFSKILFKENAQVKLDSNKVELQKYIDIRKTISDFINNVDSELFELGEKAIEIINSKGLTVNDFFQKKSGVAGFFEKLANNIHVSNLNSYVLKTLYEDIWYSKTTDKIIAEKIDEIKNNLYNILQNIYKKYNSDEMLKYNFLCILNRNIYKLALLLEVNKVLDEIRQEQNIVHISEFNKRISQIVSEEPIPYIYERLGTYYKYYLIDEFQDTSTLQWRNLMPLIENSLSYGNFNMIAGDGKQAIYRWRNGEVEQFAALPLVIESDKDIFLKQKEDSFKRHYCEKILNTNFRSAKEIIDFNNDFFKFLRQYLPESLKNIYSDVEQQWGSSISNGRIEIRFIPFDKKNAEIKQLQKEIIKENINICIKDGFNLKDITVIVRNNSNASDIAAYLLQEGINVVSSESLLLKNSDEVKFLINIARFIQDNNSKIACAAVLQYLVLTDKIVNIPENWTVNDILNSQNLNVSFLINILQLNQIELHFYELKVQPLYDMFESLLRIFKLDNTRDPFIQFLLEKVFEISISDHRSLIDFLNYWDENQNKLSIELPEEMNAVRVMTIHKSKGLEFPVVIFPYYDKNTKNNMLWFDVEEPELDGLKVVLLPGNSDIKNTRYKEVYNKEEDKKKLDLLNLLYVVMTRAKKRIYVSGVNFNIDKNDKDKDVLHDFKTMFVYYLNNINKYSIDVDLYVFGGEGKPDSISELKQENLVTKGKMISYPWQHRAIIKKNAVSFNQQQAIEWGKLVHQLLSCIDYNSENSFQSVKENISKMIQDKNEINRLNLLIDRLQTNRQFKELLTKGDEIIIEKEILTSEGNVYRPDRIVINNNSANIIDFKTGQQSDEDKMQINNYADILIQMGYKINKKYLVYIKESEEEIVEL